ncbi:Ldh family oxidoreductase [Falsiroseomonas selenitidurans]|uniref:Ldh family oxidoreductase n=1 Tax=Falsiroseomonas selenitidurans TaxID=2716335 RepID=A0ABX1EA67_9PROT|nr:Ldh family oxidoreductase [Falsiroseomonas selenitidurans]NKC34139.1 Ldh family oxidoreductase [Falsiroseomonas selenitidurans]
MSHPTPADGIALTLAEVEDLTSRALSASGVSPANLGPLVASVVAAEADGIHSHGLARLPTYCEHARCGKIDGAATPTLDQPRPGLVRVDARDGFAHPAIELGLPALIAAAKAQGIAALAVTNSYNCGVVGHHVERIAEAGLLALGFVNAPASMAPFGGNTPVFGTNPIAFAVPRADAPPLVLDQSASVVAKSELIVHQQRGQPIPEGWALDKDGNPTTDPATGLAGSMVPSGGYKGAGQALIVELMAAWLTGANLSLDASSFADNKGGSPRTGQCFLALDPGPLAGADATTRLTRLVEAITSQPNARLPGTRRLAARNRTHDHGITIPATLHARLQAYAEAAGG